MSILKKNPEIIIPDVSHLLYHKKIGDEPETTFEDFKTKIKEILMELQKDLEKEYISEDITSEEGYNNYYKQVIDSILSIIEQSDIKSYAKYWPTVEEIFLNKPFISKEKLKNFNAYLRDQGISYQLSENSSIISQLLSKDENEDTHKATAPSSFSELSPVTTVFMPNIMNVYIPEEDIKKAIGTLILALFLLLILYLLPKPKPLSETEKALQREVLWNVWTGVNGIIVIDTFLRK